jgi:hypothetical protein
MQLSTGCSVNGRTNTENQVALSANAFHNGTAWTYIASTSATQYQQAAGAHYWYNAPSGTAGNAISFTQAMTLDVSGNLLVGATSIVGSARFGVAFAGDFTNALALNDTVSASGSGFAYFQTGGSTIGSITRVGATSAVAYNTTSDQSLKSNIEDAAPVIDKLMQVQVRQYDWTEGQVHQDYGFIAQEIEPILSGVVTKGKTDVDMWQLDYSKLTPHLLKAIQEQQAIITQLQADVAALKA